MTFDENLSRTLKAVAKQAAQEEDRQKLCQLVIEINGLLDVIELQLAKLGYSGCSTLN